MKKRILKRALVLFVILAMIVPCLSLLASADPEPATTPIIKTRTKTEAEVNAWLETETEDYVIEIKDVDDLACFMAYGATALAAANTANNPIANGMRLLHVIYDQDGKATGTAQVTVKLTADIVWNEGTATVDGFTPAATQVDEDGNPVIYSWTPYWNNVTAYTSASYGFRGNFDGQGHTISGLYIEKTKTVTKEIDGEMKEVQELDGNTAFIKITGEGAKIQNVTFENTYVHGTAYVGGVVLQPRGTLTMNNVHLNGAIAAQTYVGGLIGYPNNATTKNTITIENCMVSGNIHATGKAIGGFIGHSRLFDINIKNSVCYADISVATSSSLVGGFVGVAADKLTLEKCIYLGTIFMMPNEEGKVYNEVYTASFACLLRNKTTNDLTGANIIADGTGLITLKDCYYIKGTAKYALALNKSAENHNFDVTVSYTDGASNTYELYGANIAIPDPTDEKVFTSTIVAAMTAWFSGIDTPRATNGVVEIKGVQTKTTDSGFSARFVAGVRFGSGFSKDAITEIGFQVFSFGDYKGGDPKQISCETVYTSFIADGTVLSADDAMFDGADYLAMCTATWSEGESFLIRPYCKSQDGFFCYGEYAAVTFVGGALKCSAFVANV